MQDFLGIGENLLLNTYSILTKKIHNIMEPHVCVWVKVQSLLTNILIYFANNDARYVPLSKLNLVVGTFNQWTLHE